MPQQRDHSITGGLDPRVRIYRDPFNEMFVFILSATGAALVVPVLFLIVLALTDKIALWPFVGISVAAELFLIFGVARPQMKPIERVGWAALWAFSAAFFAYCFWELVVDTLL
ncbi:MAG: hypothetical protein QOI98_1889 [Solirubrobacteraceae bacterium]|jgi:hypothetical protein|nr:hypothetical protein [Solirubrobacteraceae bacterium]